MSSQEIVQGIEPQAASPSSSQLRQRLLDTVLADLMGPAGGPEEILDERYVSERYLIGRLAPRRQHDRSEPQSDEESERYVADEYDGLTTTAGTDGEDGTTEPETALSSSMQPNSMGMSFVCAADSTALQITVKWGRYVREAGQGEEYRTEQGKARQIWRRVPVDITLDPVSLEEGRFSRQPDLEKPEVTVDGRVRARNGEWHVTLFLVNGQDEPKQKKDSAWLFQPELIVEAPDGRAIFERRPQPPVGDDWEMQAMAMRYRRTVEFAVGHGVAVHADVDEDDPFCAVRLSTRVAPFYDVAQTVPHVPPGLVVDMRALAAVPDGQFHAALMPLVDAYEQWIDELAQRVASPTEDLKEFAGQASEAVRQCRETAARIRAGIQLLDENPLAAQAFRFANRAMADQRVHSLHAANVRQGKPSELAALDANVNNHTWRTFQLAFLLLNLVGLTDPTHDERSQLADLLWFPTGGGKTEAYLGVAAYTMAMRRLQGNLGGYGGHAGVAVLMRYTLRLLTLQQFQRAAALICACEVIRREDPATWGSEPFRIGLWVGMNSTPNSTEAAAEAVKALRNNNSRYSGSTPHQLTNCPWCGSEINPGKHIVVETAKQGRGRTFIYCGDKYGRCPFSQKGAAGEGLPVLTVDEEIYRRLPTLLIATVDKFAQMPWNGRIAMLFGKVDGYCERHGYRSPEIDDEDSHRRKGSLPAARTVEAGPLRPPDLIIQDELHLISGPLGTMVGLYETAVDQLSTWELDGHAVRPKIIASTATVRQAQAQVHSLFLRSLNIFPAQGLDIEDNFFAYQEDVDEEHFGRRYVGIYAPGVRHKSALIRVYTALLSATQHLYSVEAYGKEVDPWMTLVGYFNSLRELGGMKRAVDDSVSARLRRMNSAKRPGLSTRYINPYSVAELTSRRNATEIPGILDDLELSFDLTAEAEAKRNKTTRHTVDVLLATNMISVGVDVSRFGLMVVASQPKNTAEYIQATSRVGRRFPGLVFTVYNWTRPRDISHYERFEHYHATFYQQVEALSITPFAPRAIDRGLSATLVSEVRLSGFDFNANNDAAKVKKEHPHVATALAQIERRADLVAGSESAELVQQALSTRMDDWESRIRSTSGSARLGYRSAKDGSTVELLKHPDNREWTTFTCLNSLRNVEPTVNLILDEYGMDRDESRPWASTADDQEEEAA